MPETQVRSPGREDPLEKEMATHSSTLAWRIHGQRRLVGYSPRGHKESDTTKPLHFTSLLEPKRHNYWHQETLEPVLHNERSHHNEKPAHSN